MRSFRLELVKASLVAALIAPVVMSPAAAQDTLTYTAWGGDAQDIMKKVWTDPFEAQSGMKVIHDAPTDYGKLQAMVESGNVVWDVIDVEGNFAYEGGAKGLLEPIDFSIVNKDELDPRFVSEFGVGGMAWSWVLTYNKSELGDKVPGGWADLFDTANFPGKRAFVSWPTPGPLEMALIADGVKPEELYPLDLDRAFKKLDTIKQDIVWWGTGSESQQRIASGEASMGGLWNGRAHLLVESGAPVGISWEQNLATAEFMVVPKGTKNKEAAMKLIAYIVSPKGQADFAAATAYGPTNMKSLDLIPADVQPDLPSSYRDKQITLDLQYWAEHMPEISDRWYAWQTK